VGKEVMKKYYWYSYAKRYLTSNRTEYEFGNDVIKDIHPVLYTRAIQHWDVQLLNWKEITEEEYNLLKLT
jgi:hypothetical protein